MQDHHHNQQSLTAAAGATAFPQFPEHEQLRCPRCDSANTKFCYYNNYNLSQPRHFCKSCRRYWTKGGTLRNIPVGGGCRKNTKRPAPAPAPAAPASKQQHLQQQEQERGVGTGSSGFESSTQTPTTLKPEPGPTPPSGVGTGSGIPAESFTSLLGLASNGQFGSLLEAFRRSGPGQGSGLTEGYMMQNGGNSTNTAHGWPDLAINTPAGSNLQ